MLRLVKIQRAGSVRRYSFEEYSRVDYCVRGLTITTDESFVILALRFNSARHGVIAYSRGKGITESAAWQSEDDQRAETGHMAYYNVGLVAPKPAVTQEVIADVLGSAPSPGFREFVSRFLENTSGTIFYPCKDFHLEIPRATNPVRVDRTLHIAHHPNSAPLDPTRKKSGALTALVNRIEYQCPSCLRHNPFLARQCRDCGRLRPKISLHELVSVFLRLIIKVTYVAYAAIAIAFVLSAYAVVVRIISHG